MPLYDYECNVCGGSVEKFHKMDESPRYICACGGDMRKVLNTGAIKRPDAPWIKDVNGYGLNTLEGARSGKEEFIETREQARAAINRVYSDPHPRVQELRRRYLERY